MFQNILSPRLLPSGGSSVCSQYNLSILCPKLCWNSLVMRMQHITLENKQSVKGGVFALKCEVDMKEVLMLHVLLLCAKKGSPSHGVV